MEKLVSEIHGPWMPYLKEGNISLPPGKTFPSEARNRYFLFHLQGRGRIIERSLGLCEGATLSLFLLSFFIILLYVSLRLSICQGLLAMLSKQL